MDCVIKTQGTIITSGGGGGTQWIALLKLKVQLSRGDAVDFVIKTQGTIYHEGGGRGGLRY